MLGSIVIALLTVWMAIGCSYETNWPVGFYVSVFSATWYGIGRGYVVWHKTRVVHLESATSMELG
jgi:hypothetical protein